MKIRDVVIYTGKRFKVPQGIQRIDHLATHGWQLRYGGTKLFSDVTQTGRGASLALAKATEELLKRIARLPAPTKLQDAPSANKSTDLPVGIFGPISRLRAGSTVHHWSLSVSVPRFGDSPRRRTIYIGTDHTYTEQKYELALAKAMLMREDAEEAYRTAATRAKRRQSQVLRPK